MDTLPKRLTWLREVAGLSARGLGLLAGLHPTHIGLIERGHRLDPSSSAMAQIADAVGVTLDWLIAGKGEPPTETEVRAAVDRARGIRPQALDATPDTPVAVPAPAALADVRDDGPRVVREGFDQTAAEG